MKALRTDAQLTSATTRADGSLGLRFATPEMTSVEKAAVFELQNKNVVLFIQPTDEPDEIVEVKGQFEEKSPSQRLRAVLFLLWRQGDASEVCDFSQFYRNRIEAVIEQVKSKLKPE